MSNPPCPPLNQLTEKGPEGKRRQGLAFHLCLLFLPSKWVQETARIHPKENEIFFFFLLLKISKLVFLKPQTTVGSSFTSVSSTPPLSHSERNGK